MNAPARPARSAVLLAVVATVIGLLYLVNERFDADRVVNPVQPPAGYTAPSSP